MTRYGRLALAEQCWRRFGVAALIDEHVEVLKLHLPYHESDHVLAQVLNLYAGGTFGRAQSGRPEQATALPDSAFRPFRTRAARQRDEGRKRAGYKPRRKKRNQKHQRARERGYRELRLVKQWVAETTYKPEGQPNTYRLIVRRQLIEDHKGQRHLLDTHRDRYVVTNLPASVSAEEAIDMTYERCDQENVIEQMGSGLAAWRMPPVAEFDGNAARLEIARLAWNMARRTCFGRTSRCARGSRHALHRRCAG